MDNNNPENKFEKFPVAGEKPPVPAGEKAPVQNNFDMGENVPPFKGEQFGAASPDNQYYGESVDDNKKEEEKQYNEGVSDAAALINYGLDAAARQFGVETVVQKIKGFDASGSKDPIGDLFRELGIDTKQERKELKAENEVAEASQEEFRENVDVQEVNKSVDGALKAIADMKELIGEVEGADPRYEELRENAKKAGMGYFDYAVNSYDTRSLAKLFEVLNDQREKKEEEPEQEKNEGNPIENNLNNTEQKNS